MGKTWLWGGAIALLLWFIAGPAPGADLPALRSHPLPSMFQSFTTLEGEDYFADLQSTPLGALVWSDFPITVAFELEGETPEQAQAWLMAVRQGLQDWQTYLPLVETADRENADIVVVRSRPPRSISINREAGRLEIPPAQHGQAHYQVYLTATEPPRLAHRFTVYISPHQGQRQTAGTARHELGHALGIWGHSPNPADVLYETQVSDPPPISQRDLNTLKRVYQQPTRLGWPIISRHGYDSTPAP